MRFDDLNELIETVKRKNSEIGLCRTVAGYAWEWKSNSKMIRMHSILLLKIRITGGTLNL